MVRVNREYLLVLAVAMLGSTPVVPRLAARMEGRMGALPGPAQRERRPTGAPA